jgi:hypothetical protein
MAGDWVSTSELAPHSGVTPRALKKAFAKIVRTRGGTWRGARLVVRTVPGRGGRSGLHYEVRLSSLPLGIQEGLKALQQPLESPWKPLHDMNAESRMRVGIVAPIVAHPPYTAERRKAFAAVLATRHTGPDGALLALSESTLRRWVKLYDAKGIAGVASYARRDKGISRVVISKPWDIAVAKFIDHVGKHRIAVALRSYIRGLYKDDSSYAVVSQLAAGKLQELTVDAIGAPALDLPNTTFHVGRRFIEAERRFRNVAIFDKDRKAYEDAKPRVLRTREGLEPMAIIVGDVHHIDIVTHRPDGSEAWPKAIAWLDLATNRIWFDIVLLGKGEGIRNADVIASFMRMVAAWGLPRALYLDNGSEYRWSDFIDDALKLVARIECTDDRDSQIIRAQPYNAAAKPIEGIFRVLEYCYFRTLPGWCGGDRTNKKTASVGKPPEPFPGSIDDFRAAIGACLTLYEGKPQRGALQGRSPRQAYEGALAAGWQRIAVDARELHTVFAVDELRMPRQGYVSYAGDKWTCPELQAYLGNTILLRVPKFDAPTVLPLLDPETRQVIGFAEPARRYAMLDPAGAKAASAMAKTRRAAIRDLDRLAPDIDTNAEIAKLAASVPMLPPAPIAATIGVSDEAKEIAAGTRPGATATRDEKRRAKLEADQKALDVSTKAFKQALFKNMGPTP